MDRQLHTTDRGLFLTHGKHRPIYSPIASAKLNNIDPQAWLADVLARLPDHSAKRIYELLPWNWRPQNVAHAA